MSSETRPDNGHDDTPPGTVFGRAATRPRFVPHTDTDADAEPELEPEPAVERAAAEPEPEPEPAVERAAAEPEPAPDAEPEPAVERAAAEPAPEPEPEPAAKGAAEEPEPALAVVPVPTTPVETEPAADPAEPTEPTVPTALPTLPDELTERWESVQIGFVDDPRLAVENAAGLVTAALTALDDTWRDDGSSTEDLRVAFQRYRAVFRVLADADPAAGLTPRR
jgi:hypothetical protein